MLQYPLLCFSLTYSSTLFSSFSLWNLSYLSLTETVSIELESHSHNGLLLSVLHVQKIENRLKSIITTPGRNCLSRFRAMPVELPFDIWLHIGSFIPFERFKVLYTLNSAFFNLEMNVRYKEVDLCRNSRKPSIPETISRLQWAVRLTYSFQSVIEIHCKDLICIASTPWIYVLTPLLTISPTPMKPSNSSESTVFGALALAKFRHQRPPSHHFELTVEQSLTQSQLLI
jgi:hypothetical protein